MRILYIFPHPDDESFGPAGVIYKQLSEGHSVHLLTLTKGGATKMRHEYGYSVEEMGNIRYREMLCVEKTLGLTSMEVLDLEDGGLAEMDLAELKSIIRNRITALKPDVVVTYPVHGISMHPDHITSHFIVKEVYQELKKKEGEFLKRLVFLTLPPNKEDNKRRSKEEDIDCVVKLSAEEVEKFKQSLACYKTYEKVILEHGVIEEIGDKVFFEIYDENFEPPLNSLTDQLP